MPLSGGDIVPKIQGNSKSSSELEPEKDWTYIPPRNSLAKEIIHQLDIAQDS
jgi:hypothetical protein